MDQSRYLLRMCLLVLVSGMAAPCLTAQGQVFIFTEAEELEPNEPVFHAGSLGMLTSPFDFAEASEEEPVYVRLDMPAGTTLAETHVAPGAGPLYLAILSFLDETMDADPAAVAIVRWVAGEGSIWIRVSSSSETWVTFDHAPQKRGAFGEENDFLSFAWFFGQEEGESTQEVRPFFNSDRANLPSNTRQIEPEPGADAGTELLLNVVDVTANSDGAITGQAFVGSQGVETEIDPGNIELGQLADIIFFPALLFFVDDGPGGPSEPVIVQASPVVVTPGDDCSQAGFFGIDFDPEIFEDAREEEPVFLRIGLSEGAQLCETLVNPLDPDMEPIFLAIGDPSGVSSVTASPEALAIVRWIEGEEALWLAVTEPSDEWTTFEGGRLQWMLGISGAESEAFFGPLFQVGSANLPANTRNVDLMTPEDTFLSLELDAGDINPIEPILWADMLGFGDTPDVFDEEDPDEIEFGEFIGISASGPIAFLDVTDQPQDPAGILVTSVLQDVNVRGRCEVTGDFSMEINGDAFPFASEEEPRYMRVRPRNGAVLCETLVAPQTGNPIFLAMRLDAAPGSAVITAEPTAVSIVRWVAGETDVWLKVTQPSNQWVSIGPVVQPPSNDVRVRLSFGTSGLFSFEQNQPLVAQGLANLVANSTSPTADSSDEALDTLIRVDLANSELRPTLSGWKGFLPAEPTIFSGASGVETAPDPGGIITQAAENTVVFGLEDVAQGELALINPAVIVQGVGVQTSTAVPALDLGVEVNSAFKWEVDSEVVAAGLSIPWDPIPTFSFSYHLTVTDRHGRSDRIRGTVLVNPDGVDLNNDGFNTMDDLFVATPRWPHERNILNLMTIRIDNPPAPNLPLKPRKREATQHD